MSSLPISHAQCAIVRERLLTSVLRLKQMTQDSAVQQQYTNDPLLDLHASPWGVCHGGLSAINVVYCWF